MATRNIQVNVDDATYQTTVNKAAGEGKTVTDVLTEFLTQYAEGASTGSPTTYTIQRGDTLGRIAAKFYGNASKYPIIQRANNIANPNRIWVGQVLIIPSISGSTPPPPPPPVAVPPTLAPPPPPSIAPAPAPSTPAPPPPPSTPATSAPVGPPAKPSIRWVGSPHFNNRRRPDDITGIVIHSTANSSLERVVEWFNNPGAKVSAHYTIGKDGQIVQHVQDTHRAWHAGRSIWKGREGCNDYTIGIELVNLNDGSDPYPEEQYKATAVLCTWLAQKYNISVEDIMGHLDIAIPPGRKSDPRGFDLNRLRKDVAAALR